MNYRLWPAPMLLGLIAGCPAFADEDAGEVLSLDKLTVVTPTRTETSLRDALSAVKVITRGQIERSQARDLGDILRFVSGIDVARTGGPGQQTSVFIRGSESNHTLVLIDGVRINPATIGVAAIQNISPSLIERIEIVTGPRSSLYGSDAIGGVINVITRTASNSMSTDLTLRGGGDNQQEIAANTAGRDGAFNWGAGVNWRRSGGLPTRDFSTIDRGYENVSASVNLGANVGRGDIDLRHWQAEGLTEYADFFGAPVDQDYRNSATALTWRQPVNDNWQSRLSLSRINDEIDQNQSPDYLRTRRTSIDWQNTINVGDRQTLVAGVDHYTEDAQSLSFGTGFDEQIEVSAGYLQHQFSGARFDALLAMRLTDHDAFGTEFTWNAEVGVPLNDDWVVQFNAGRAFRAPDASDRFGFGGNPTLEPESSQQYQARVIYRPVGGWQFALEFFDNDITNLIDFDFTDFTLQNISAANIRGTELSGQWASTEWQLDVALLAQSAENADDGSRLLRRAQRSATVTAARLIGEHSVSLSVRADGARDDFGGIRLPGYVLASIGVQYQVTPRWQMSALVDNLLDTDYQTAASFNTQDRATTVQLRYTW